MGNEGGTLRPNSLVSIDPNLPSNASVRFGRGVRMLGEDCSLAVLERPGSSYVQIRSIETFDAEITSMGDALAGTDCANSAYDGVDLFHNSKEGFGIGELSTGIWVWGIVKIIFLFLPQVLEVPSVMERLGKSDLQIAKGVLQAYSIWIVFLADT